MSPAEALVEALGDVAERHDPMRIEGLDVEATVRPHDGDDLSRVLAWLSDHKQPVLVRGGGTRTGFGNVPRPVHAVLSTERIAGVTEFDADDGVLNVLAGTPLVEVAREVSAAGWEVPLEAPGARATVGGVIATAATGPRRQRFGPPRNAILGLDVVLATGERTSCGGRVVKNVTGYDMAKLYCGSFGALGVIESAWLRLRPKPALVKTAVVAFDGADPERDAGVGLAAARRVTVRTAALVTGEPATRLGAPSRDGGAAALVVEYGGDAPAVERDVAWLLEQAGGREVSEAARLVDHLRDLQGSGEMRARIAVPPTVLGGVQAALAGLGLGTIAYPGDGIVYAIAPDRAKLPQIEQIAGGASLVFEALPLEARRTRDVFGEPGPEGAIARALKERFDPAGILNPGRFQGRL